MLNHYQTLEIPPLASQQEVKRAYRALAFKYHPDKNPDAYAVERFKEIQYAYSIVGDPDKRKAFDREMWLTGFQPAHTFVPATAVTILKDSIRIRQYVSIVNIFSIDQDALLFHLKKLLSPVNLEKLSDAANEKLDLQVVREAVQASKALKFAFVVQLESVLKKLAATNEESMALVGSYFRKRKQAHRLEQALPVAVLLVVAVLCWLMNKYGS